MINKEKVAVMTRMAAYEAGEGKKDTAVCSYFRSDYIGFQLLKTWVGCTVAFCILACIYLVYQMDSLVDSIYGLKLDELLSYGKRFLTVYVIFCGIYLLAAYVTAHLAYRRARRNIALFDKALNTVDKDTGEPEEEE